MSSTAAAARSVASSTATVGEPTQAGAIRETLEEAGAEVTTGALFSLLNVTHVQQVHMFYIATLNEPVFSAGVESLEVALFTESEIPWEEIAFPTVKRTLEWFFKDRADGKLGDDVVTHLADIPYDERIDRKHRHS